MQRRRQRRGQYSQARMSKHYVQVEGPIFWAAAFLPSNVSRSRAPAAVSTECQRAAAVTRRGSASHPSPSPTSQALLWDWVLESPRWLLRPVRASSSSSSFFFLLPHQHQNRVRSQRVWLSALTWPVDVSDCSLYGQTPSTGRSFTAVTSLRGWLAAESS